MWEFKYKVQFKMQAAGHIQKQNRQVCLNLDKAR